MCGIAGWAFTNKVELRNTDQIIDTMVQGVLHRGPDASGTLVQGAVGLGHARLKILDLIHGAQPMVHASGVTLVYNGEVFNFRALREELEGLGHTFSSTGDTEVILAAYVQWGRDCVQRLHGQFAFAIHDPRSDELLLARDRLGIKPLYYARTGDGIVFGSEVKSILAHGGIEPKLNPRALTSYLSYRYPLGSESWFEGVSMIEPGTLLVATPGSIQQERYHDLPGSTKGNDQSPQLRAHLDTAVRSQMVSDVPLGAYLSGGLDSSALVGLMQQYKTEPIKTFTVRFAEKGHDETKYASLVAQMHGTQHVEVPVSEDRYLSSLPHLIRMKDAPLGVPNEVPLYLMSKRLKQDITVVLSGEGADELFCGYGRLFRMPHDMELIQQTEDQALQAKLRDIYGDDLDAPVVDLFLNTYTYTPFDLQRRLFNAKAKAAMGGDVGLREQWVQEFAKWDALPLGEALRRVMLRKHVPGLLLRADTCSMAASVEARVPFLDDELVDWALQNVPYKALVRWRSPEAEQEARTRTSHEISETLDETKAALRSAVQDVVPKEVVERRKMGFPVPLDAWMGSRLDKVARELLLDDETCILEYCEQAVVAEIIDGLGTTRRHGQIVWMLVNLEIWMRMYFHGEPPERLTGLLQ